MKRLIYFLIVAFMLLGFSKPSFAQTTSFLETFDGAPAPTPPLSFVNTQAAKRWDVASHARDDRDPPLNPQPAHHSGTCADAGAQHVTDGSEEEGTFLCNNHVMTAADGDGYSAIYLTPNHMVDWTNQEAVISFEISTYRSSERDWFDVWITPYQNNIQLPLEYLWPDLQGPPRHAIQVQLSQTVSYFCPQVWRDFQGIVDTAPPYTCRITGYESVLTRDRAQREKIEIRIRRVNSTTGHMVVRMLPRSTGTTPGHNGLTWWDNDIPLISGFNGGVVQFGHHAYDPEKGTFTAFQNPTGPNTWHWDTVSINPSIPFSIIHADRRFIDPTGSEGPSTTDRFNLDQAVPANSHLRFSAWGNNIEWSSNNGASWHTAQRAATDRDDDSHIWNYWTPIPAGTTNVRLRGSGQLGGSLPFYVKDLTVWSTTAGTVPTSTPTPPPATPTQSVPTNTPTPQKPGDVNGDGFINSLDLNEIVINFNRTGIGMPADLNNDGIVNALDFNEVVANYGR